MPKKKTVTPDEQHMETMTAAETDGEDANTDLFLEDVSALESAVDDFPANNESHFPEVDAPPAPQQPQEGMGSESGGPEYGALLQESGEAGQKEASTEEPLTLGLPPGEEPVGAASFPVLSGVEDGMAGEPPAPPRRPRGRPRRAENAASAADPRHDRVLTIEARDEVQTAKEREDLIWHELQNAY